MSGHPYQYVVLRCVPRVDREEFVNVGVVLYAQSADFLALAGHVDEPRLLALDGSVDVEAVRDCLATVAGICAGIPGTGRPDLPTLGKRFGWIAAPRSTVIQPGPIHGGITSDPTTTLEALLHTLVR